MARDGGEDGDGGEDLALAARAAWLYHAGGMTQAQVAAELGVPSVKAHRLIARAVRAGIVRVLVEGSIGGCIALERELSDHFGLAFCRVVPSLGERDLPLKALGTAVSTLLHDVLSRDSHRVIGVGHGRTLGAAIDMLPRIAAPEATFVSLLGGLTRYTGSSPFDVIHRLAEKTGAEAWLLPVPFIANTEAERGVLLAQRGIAEAMRKAAEATLCLVGIGEMSGDAFLRSSGVLSAEEILELLAAGAVGEVLGRFFDAEGQPVVTSMCERVIAGLPLASRGASIVAVAGGPSKTNAIRAVLKGGVPNGLITDEATAERLLASDEHYQKNKQIKNTGRETCTKGPEISARRSSSRA